MAEQQADPVADILRKQPTTDAMRAKAWDAYQAASDEDSLAESLKEIGIPNTAKAALWNLKHGEAPKPQEMPATVENPSDSEALAGIAAKAAVPALDAFSQSAKVPKIGSKIGRVVGGMAPIVGGFEKAGPGGAAIGMAGASSGAWAGGRTGWFTAKMLQNLAKPVVGGAKAVAPVLDAANIVQGALDVTQMAEPERKDIGVLGVSGTADVLGDPKAVARVVNASPSIGDAIANLKQLGMSQAEAVKTVLDIKWLSRRLEKK